MLLFIQYDSNTSNHVASKLSKLSIRYEYEGDDFLIIANKDKFCVSYASAPFYLPFTDFRLQHILLVSVISINLFIISNLISANNVFLEFSPLFLAMDQISTESDWN